jgi:hypothetical protein
MKPGAFWQVGGFALFFVGAVVAAIVEGKSEQAKSSSGPIDA